MNHAKEELDKERKLLQRKRPQLEKETSGSKSTKETKQSSVKCNYFIRSNFLVQSITQLKEKKAQI